MNQEMKGDTELMQAAADLASGNNVHHKYCALWQPSITSDVTGGPERWEAA